MKNHVRRLVCGVLAGLIVASCSSNPDASPDTSVAVGSATPAATSQQSAGADEPTSTSASAEPTTESAAPSGPWPADLTPDQQVAAQAALAAYTGLRGIIAAAYADPKGKDWSTELAPVATPARAERVIESVRILISRNAHSTGAEKFTARVESVAAGSITVLACIDSRGQDVVTAAGESIADPNRLLGSFAQRGIVLFDASAQSWKVDQLVNPDPVQQC